MTTVLVVLDGWGHREAVDSNAIALAKTPNFDALKERGRFSLLKTHGKAVGLPETQCGNSEVGHLTLGAGRSILHPRLEIFKKLQQALEHKTLDRKFAQLGQTSSDIHLIGIYSSGGVHGLDDLTHTWCKFLTNYTQSKIHLHLITDGRDEPFGALKGQLESLEQFLKPFGSQVVISTITGRYYAMDRDRQYDKTQQFIDALLAKSQLQFQNPLDVLAAIRDVNNQSEEFLLPHTAASFNGIRAGDVVININYRTDRAKQWFFSLKKQLDLKMYSTVALNDMPDYEVLCPSKAIDQTLNDLLFDNQLKQLRLTESEKMPHVTYFFDGLTDRHADKYDKIIIDSHKAKTWANVPQMRADEIATVFGHEFDRKYYDFILVNLTNADLVGHSGDLDATIIACEAVDRALGRIMQKLSSDDHLFVTADHGNAEIMKNSSFKPHTAHTKEAVPFCYQGPLSSNHRLKSEGEIGQVAATIAQSFDISPYSPWIPTLFEVM